VFVVNQFGERICMSVADERYKPVSIKSGLSQVVIDFFEMNLMPGNYSLSFAIAYHHSGSSIDFVESFFPFTVSKESFSQNLEYPWETIHGYFRPRAKWQIQCVNTN
jgi:hypothetical protein